jgi:hypothetical protein
MSEPTLEERIQMAKAKYEGKPADYKGSPPKAGIVPVKISEFKPEDLAKLTVTESKAVTALLTQAQTLKEKRLITKEIERKLKPKDNLKIPPEINDTTIKNLPLVMKSKIETGVNRANFLLECIQWEKEQFQPKPQVTDFKTAEEDQINLLFGTSATDIHFWSDKAIGVVSGWIGICANDKSETKQLYEMCLVLFKSRLVKTNDKLDIASAFYLALHYDFCYDLYDTILTCQYTLTQDRTECCKFLYCSGNAKYIPHIEKHLTDIIESDVDDDVRYQSLANYVTTTGLSTRHLTNMLVPEEINQGLLARLFLKFINTKCDHLYIIMSCEFLLEQDEDKDIYVQVCEKLLSIANDKSLGERTRADAADVLLNHPIAEYAEKAQEIIQEIGEAGQTELEKTIYSNKENVHMLNTVFSKYVIQNHKKYMSKLVKFDDICEIIEDKITDMSEESIFKIRQSVDRITLEPTLHTERKISTVDIFRIMWTIVQNHKEREALELRFIQELEDMAATCSSGHAKRLVNVMVGFTDDLEGCIDVADQLQANIKARLMATIRNLVDSDKKDELLSGMVSKDGGFVSHINSHKDAIEKELYGEFVVEGWISEKKFRIIFNDTVKKIVE